MGNTVSSIIGTNKLKHVISDRGAHANRMLGKILGQSTDIKVATVHTMHIIDDTANNIGKAAIDTAHNFADMKTAYVHTLNHVDLLLDHVDAVGIAACEGAGIGVAVRSAIVAGKCIYNKERPTNSDAKSIALGAAVGAGIKVFALVAGKIVIVPLLCAYGGFVLIKKHKEKKDLPK